MTREIKFRAWVKDAERMVYNNDEWYTMISNGDGFSLVDNDNNSWQDKDNVEIMQYTGLEDKNGEEIYEGDILRYYSNHNFLPESTELYQNRRLQIVEYGGSSFYRKDISKYGDTGEFRADYLEYIEVIGNIYENSELIKK